MQPAHGGEGVNVLAVLPAGPASSSSSQIQDFDPDSFPFTAGSREALTWGSRKDYREKGLVCFLGGLPPSWHTSRKRVFSCPKTSGK